MRQAMTVRQALISYDDLGDRMKLYERRETDRSAMPRLPLYARIDGRCFHAFTRGMERPFDPALSEAMIELTKFLVAEMHPLIGYTQSDEISLAWWATNPETQLPFGGRFFKLASCLASLATARFMMLVQERWPERMECFPTFDCRVFSLPTDDELANVFLWRERDATKNAVSMAACAYYGPPQLHGKKVAEMQEMLWAKGVNFNDYPASFKRGTFVRRVTVSRKLSRTELLRIPECHWPTAPVERSEVHALEMPPFGTVTNRVAVVVSSAEPEL
jgi:tRNA(His) guanylyltransferase